jgi:hypothetical protein
MNFLKNTVCKIGPPQGGLKTITKPNPTNYKKKKKKKKKKLWKRETSPTYPSNGV